MKALRFLNPMIGDVVIEELALPVGLPSFVVINTAGLSSGFVPAGGIATCLLGDLLFHAISHVIATDSPLRRERSPRSGPVSSIDLRVPSSQ